MEQINGKLFRRTMRLAAPYWRSERKWEARGLLLLLILLLVGYAEFSVLFNQQSGEFTSALAAREPDRFWRAIRSFFLLLVIAVPIDAYYYFVRDKLALSWRRWLTHRFLDRYLDSRNYYRLLGKPEIDNPDQRIADDVSAFTAQSLVFLLTLANGLLQLFVFSKVLWSISGYLVLFLFVYAMAITATSFGLFGKRLVGLNAAQRRREADFRFALVRVRGNAESIALHRGESQERQRLREVLDRLLSNSRSIIGWSLKLNFVTYGNTFLAMVLPTLIIAPRVLSGELEVGSIVQATGAFTAILAALTLLLDNLQDLSVFAASVTRLDVLHRELTPANGRPSTVRERRIAVREGSGLRFDNVTVETPRGERTLVRELSLSLEPGERLMIAGASGLGKSSLLRVIAGLWERGQGAITRPPSGEMMFLPQHAYLVAGSLRDQLSYPSPARRWSDEEYREALEMVNLGGLMERCGGLDAEFDFERILSLGERQRLAFARVFLNRPKYVLLDEATSALDGANEELLYGLLSASGATVVSVSHHPALEGYHTRVLELRAEGAWRMRGARRHQLEEVELVA